MDSKYQAVKVVDDDKLQDPEVFLGRTSTSTSDLTLLENEEDHRATSLKRKNSARWIWVAHGVLLTLSFTMLLAAYNARASTLVHVNKFSAYCELHHESRLSRSNKTLAPAASAVEYQKVKFNVNGTSSPYVGASPEVDKAWDAIFYDSRLSPRKDKRMQL